MANDEARSTAYVSFDGRNQQELRVGDRSVVILHSEPFSLSPYYVALLHDAFSQYFFFTSILRIPPE